MKKLAIAVVICTASFSFANAQSTDAVKMEVGSAAETKEGGVLNAAVLMETAVKEAKVEGSSEKIQLIRPMKPEKARTKEAKVEGSSEKIQLIRPMKQGKAHAKEVIEG
jgi:hypothetical protein